ncbi:hypothetical protein HYV58_02050 [Candidatus Peregrinibacteria bacterium]|nr:hypothetical protein [Candidatus Peregrinibacteria bacterium]
MFKRRIFFIILGVLLLSVLVLFRAGGGGTELLWSLSDEGKRLLPLVMVASVIDSINPCAFSVLLLTLAFLFSIGKLRRDIVKIGGIYIVGIFAAYMAIGLGLLQALHLFNTPHFISKIAAAVMLVVGGLAVINELFPSFPLKLRIPHASHHAISNLMAKATVPAAFALGVLVGLCEFPCTGGPYLMVIGLLHDNATWAKGFAYLLLYNVIFVAPLIVILGLSGDYSVIQKIEQWERTNKRSMRLVGGLAMIALGLFILFM